MDEVEADEIISAAEGFGSGARRGSSQSTADKQQVVYGKTTTTTRNAQQPQSTLRMLSKKLLLVNLLANFLMFAIAGFITYHCFNKATVLFSWHPTFMSIGVSNYNDYNSYRLSVEGDFSAETYAVIGTQVKTNLKL